MTDHVVMLLSIGPVQDLIASARRCRDLWFGSWLLADAARTAAEHVASEASKHGAELRAFNGRMGRVVEMNGRSFMEDGVTEICCVLLDARSTDYDRISGVWVGVPVANLELQ